MEEITKIQRHPNGQIISFQTSTGRIISYQKAVMEANEGLLAGVSVDFDEEGFSQLADNYNQGSAFSDLPEIF
ncbi:DUF3892 domain-containing protein [Bacillus salacetis]|nr:DUF3892 domain-containing protein [Bacillus salacetis]